MDTTTQEIIYQIMALIISGVFVLIGAYIKSLKYVKDNERIERIIDNAVSYAEQFGKGYAVDASKELASHEKLAVAKEYINKIDKKIITKYANELELMIDRKVAQKFGIGTDGTVTN